MGSQDSGSHQQGILTQVTIGNVGVSGALEGKREERAQRKGKKTVPVEERRNCASVKGKDEGQKEPNEIHAIPCKEKLQRTG